MHIKAPFLYQVDFHMDQRRYFSIDPCGSLMDFLCPFWQLCRGIHWSPENFRRAFYSSHVPPIGSVQSAWKKLAQHRQIIVKYRYCSYPGVDEVLLQLLCNSKHFALKAILHWWNLYQCLINLIWRSHDFLSGWWALGVLICKTPLTSEWYMQKLLERCKLCILISVVRTVLLPKRYMCSECCEFLAISIALNARNPSIPFWHCRAVFCANWMHT